VEIKELKQKTKTQKNNKLSGQQNLQRGVPLLLLFSETWSMMRGEHREIMMK
jgi:hypothetical protein